MLMDFLHLKISSSSFRFQAKAILKHPDAFFRCAGQWVMVASDSTELGFVLNVRILARVLQILMREGGFQHVAHTQ